MSELYEKATPRPWAIFAAPIKDAEAAKEELIYQVDHTEPLGDTLFLLDAGGKCPATTGCGPTSQANAELIVHAVNNIERLEALNKSYREALFWALPLLEDVVENNDIDPDEVCDTDEIYVCCNACHQSGCLSAKLQKVRAALKANLPASDMGVDNG